MVEASSEQHLKTLRPSDEFSQSRRPSFGQRAREAVKNFFVRKQESPDPGHVLTTASYAPRNTESTAVDTPVTLVPHTVLTPVKERPPLDTAALPQVDVSPVAPFAKTPSPTPPEIGSQPSYIVDTPEGKTIDATQGQEKPVVQTVRQKIDALSEIVPEEVQKGLETTVTELLKANESDESIVIKLRTIEDVTQREYALALFARSKVQLQAAGRKENSVGKMDQEEAGEYDRLKLLVFKKE